MPQRATASVNVSFHPDIHGQAGGYILVRSPPMTAGDLSFRVEHRMRQSELDLRSHDGAPTFSMPIAPISNRPGANTPINPGLLPP